MGVFLYLHFYLYIQYLFLINPIVTNNLLFSPWKMKDLHTQCSLFLFGVVKSKMKLLTAQVYSVATE
jgi:hypothetical protein